MQKMEEVMTEPWYLVIFFPSLEIAINISVVSVIHFNLSTYFHAVLISDVSYIFEKSHVLYLYSYKI